MSLVEAPPRPRWFQRLDTLYFFLAAFDLLTICVALFLNHNATTAFEQAVRASAASSERQVEIIQLSRLARDATAPGDDVFASRAVSAERDRQLRAFARFDEAMAQAKARYSQADPTDRQIGVHLEAADLAMNEVKIHGASLFSEFSRDRVNAAGRNMARMDRAFGAATEHLEQALAVVNGLRAQQLERQLSHATQLRQLEWAVGSALLIIVSLVAAYGLHVGRTLRANETQRLAMAKEIAAARDRMQHYADDVSHELRGAISKMRLNAEVLLQIDRTPEQYRAGVETILVECQHLSAIVESLLFLARSDNTKVALQPAPLDAAKELGVIAEFYAAAADRAGVALIADSTPAVAWADRALFQRALSNLVNNALAHTPRGGRITLRARPVSGGAEIEVADTGPGIAPELLPSVFDRFRRGPGKHEEEGLGLGLAITKSIVELHQGTIALVNGQQGGLRALLYFPQRESAASAQSVNYRPVISAQ